MNDNPHHDTWHEETKNGFYKPQDTLKTWQWMWIFLLWLLSATNLDLSRLDFIKCTGRLWILLVKSVLRVIINQNFLCPLWIIWATKQKIQILNFIVKNKTTTTTTTWRTNKQKQWWKLRLPKCFAVLNTSWIMTVSGQRILSKWF